MKKYAKIIVLILTVFTFCTILCSCDALDEMRDDQGYWKKDGTILYQDNVYVKVDHYANVNFDEVGHGGLIYITEKNIPVLLSKKYGSRFNITKDEVIITAGNEIYALAGKHAEIEKDAEKTSKGNYDFFTVSYFDTYDMEQEFDCTPEETAAIKATISKRDTTQFEWEITRDFHLYENSKSGYFGGYYGTIAQLDDGRYIITNGDIGFVVPEEYKKTFDGLYSKRVDYTAK